MKTDRQDTIINTKELRAELKRIVERVRAGERYTVLYRSRPVFRIVPVDEPLASAMDNIDSDPLYRAPALGRSDSGDLADRHDEILYSS